LVFQSYRLLDSLTEYGRRIINLVDGWITSVDEKATTHSGA